MANESTKTTLVGIMETLNLGLYASMYEFSSLWNAPLVGEANDTLNVIFPTIDSGIRSATADAATEGGSVANTAITVAANTAVLTDYPVLALVSNTAIKGGSNVLGTVSRAVGVKVGNTIDKLIYSTGKEGFSTSISSSDGFGVGDLMSMVGSLKSAGYPGPFTCIADWRQLQGEYGLMNDVLTTNNPGANDEIIRGSGYLGTVNGVEIYGTHHADTYTGASDSTWAYGFVFAKDALGFAYGTPMFDLRSADAPEKSGAYVYGSCFIAAKLLDSSGGTRIESRVA